MIRALASLLLLLAWASAASALERYAVVIGNDRGAPGEVQLRYAETDTEKMAAVLRELGGVPPENLLLLRNENADAVLRALISLNERIRAHAGDATLLVYYSGHSDAQALHLGRSTLPLDQLAQLVRGSAARFRVLVLDSCRSGALTRMKGGTHAPPFVIHLDGDLENEGAVILTASAANEDAQESDEIKGSFFTHYLVSGLSGAADENGDELVTLEEAYRYAYDNTLRASSRTLAGAQHPSFAISVRGQGNLVLASLRSASSRWASIELPPGRGYLLFFRDVNGGVAAELGPDDRTRTLVVRPGRYFVRGRGSQFMLEGTVTLEPGQRSRLDESHFVRVEYARLVRKGAAERELVQSPFAAYRVRTSILHGATPCEGVLAGYGLELQHLTIEPRVAWCRGTFANDHVSADTDEFNLSVALGHAWDFPWITLRLSLVGGVALLRETFIPLQGGYAPARDTVAGDLAAELVLTHTFRHGVFLFGGLSAAMYVFASQSTVYPHPTSTSVVPAGVFTIGIGKQIR